MRWILLLLSLASLEVSAHGGGLDANGCHNDRKNGGYHCHRSQTAIPSYSRPAPSYSPPPSTATTPAASPRPMSPLVFKCLINGTTVYRDTPCPTEAPPPPVAAAAASGKMRATVDATNLQVRSRQSSNSPAIGRLARGTLVTVLDSRGSWWKIDPDGPLGPGYVAARYLKPGVVLLSPPPAPKKSDAEIAQQIIRDSIARYPGSCACPYNYDRGGRRCGARSAYSKPGGNSPICYESDIPTSMIQSRR